jgi:hypothetical protein
MLLKQCTCGGKRNIGNWNLSKLQLVPVIQDAPSSLTLSRAQSQPPLSSAYFHGLLLMKDIGLPLLSGTLACYFQYGLVSVRHNKVGCWMLCHLCQSNSNHI